MGVLATELRDMGYERTERESPFDEQGELWTNSFELVCDETGIVIRKDGGAPDDADEMERTIYRYRNSEEVKLIGGHMSNYDWGQTENGFTYER